MTSGYTVAKATAGASNCSTLIAFAKAGGLAGRIFTF